MNYFWGGIQHSRLSCHLSPDLWDNVPVSSPPQVFKQSLFLFSTNPRMQSTWKSWHGADTVVHSKSFSPSPAACRQESWEWWRTLWAWSLPGWWPAWGCPARRASPSASWPDSWWRCGRRTRTRRPGMKEDTINKLRGGILYVCVYVHMYGFIE